MDLTFSFVLGFTLVLPWFLTLFSILGFNFLQGLKLETKFSYQP